MKTNTLTTVIAFFALALAAACTRTPSEPTMAVFHTRTATLTAPLDAEVADALKTRVRGFYPAACLDADDDDDGLPNSSDLNTPDDDDDADDAEEAESNRCRVCNRGPGKSGDFRLEVSGGTAKLDRGNISAVSGNTLTIPTPNGALSVVLGGENAAALPGAQIRVEGSYDAASKTLTATSIEVLCPAAGTMPEDQVPPDTTPLPPTDGEVILL